SPPPVTSTSTPLLRASQRPSLPPWPGCSSRSQHSSATIISSRASRTSPPRCTSSPTSSSPGSPKAIPPDRNQGASRRNEPMRVETEAKAYDDINITPMLDLAYVLLVIFIIMTTASVQGIKVDLPKASDAPSLAKPKTKAITISSDGKIFLDTYPVTMDELEQRITQQKAIA